MWTTFLMLGLVVLVFFFMFRSQKKQEKEANDMRNNLQIGDEVTTIGGIIGEIVRIKEETVTIETGKDRTKIRILRSAIRSVDVHAVDKYAISHPTPEKPVEEQPAEVVVEETKTTKKEKKEKKKKSKKSKAEDIVVEAAESETPVDASVEAVVEETFNEEQTTENVEENK